MYGRGTQRNEFEGMKLLTRAAEAGDEEAIAFVAERTRGAVVASVSPTRSQKRKQKRSKSKQKHFVEKALGDHRVKAGTLAEVGAARSSLEGYFTGSSLFKSLDGYTCQRDTHPPFKKRP